MVRKRNAESKAEGKAEKLIRLTFLAMTEQNNSRREACCTKATGKKEEKSVALSLVAPAIKFIFNFGFSSVEQILC